MTDTDHYLKADAEDRADLSRIQRDDEGNYTPEKISSPRRDALLEVVLDTEVRSVRNGRYQGTMGFVFVVDGLLWLLKDSFGSCAVCDGLMGARDDDGHAWGNTDPEDLTCTHVREYTASMLRNAYAFESKNDAVRFLHQAEDDELEAAGWSWRDIADDMIDVLDDVEY